MPTLLSIYERLLASYGCQHWWPADSPFEVMVGAVLTQNTAWTNVERAIRTLKAAAPMTAEGLLAVHPSSLRKLVRSSGYFRQKARRLRILCAHVRDEWGGDAAGAADRTTESLREDLLSLEGIGPETADSILLYALGRPVFVVDAYTVRLTGRLGLTDGKAGYHDVQRLFSEALPHDAALYNEFHALIVRHAKERCRRRDPACPGCPLRRCCRFPAS